jgi:imidazolonepropionase-like amidohydrolase
MTLCSDRAASWYWNSSLQLWEGLRNIEFDSEGKISTLDSDHKYINWDSSEAGEYFLPGLIDMHVHLGEDPRPRYLPRISRREGFTRVIEANLEKALECGITTLRDVGSLGVSVAQFEKLREYRKRANIIFPRVYSAGSFLTKCGSHGSEGMFMTPGRLIESSDEARAWIEIMQKEGAHLVKVMNDPVCFSDSELQMIGEICRSRGLHLAIHAFTDEGAQAAISAKAHSIEHASKYSSAIEDEIISSRIFVCTTFTAALDAALSPLMCSVDEFDPTCHHSTFIGWFDSICEGLPSLWHKGARIYLGTDAGCPGTDFDSLWREIFALRALGLKMEECLHASTVTSAEALGMGDKLGQIKLGFLGDLSIFPTNPLLKRRKPSSVYISGRLAWPRS